MRQPFIWLLLAVACNAQTRVDLASQGKNIDFSNAVFTKPFKVGGTLPATCTVNEAFLQMTGNTGTLYVCASANQWQTVSARLTTGSMLMGANQTTFTYNSATGSIDGLKLIDGSGNSGTGVLGHFATASGSSMIPWQADANGTGFRVDASGAFRAVGQTGAGTVTLERGVGATAFVMQGATAGQWSITPPDNFASWTFTPPPSPAAAHQWLTTDASGVGSFRQPAMADLSDASIIESLAQNQTVTGNRTYQGVQDASGAVKTLPFKTGLAAALPASCTIGEIYFASDGEAGRQIQKCSALNIWKPIAYSQDTATNIVSSSCARGQMAFAIDATAGRNLYFCTATNSWTQMSLGVVAAKMYWPFAACNNGTAAAVWNYPSASTLGCYGVTTRMGVWQAATGDIATISIPLTSDWTGAIDASISFNTPDTTGSVIFNIAVACVAQDGSAADDPAFNTASAFPTVTLGAPANAARSSTVTGVATSGISSCAAGNWMNIKITRAADSAPSRVNAKGVLLTLRSSM